MDVDEARKTAEENFLKGCNCAQAVLLTFCDELGIDRDMALRMAQPFGGGTCRLREMCGTCTGILLALGFTDGSSDYSDKAAKDEIYRKGQMLLGKFKEQHGSFICRELLGLVPSGDRYLAENTVSGEATKPVSEARTESYYKKRPCPKLCGDSAAILAEYLNSEQSLCREEK